MSKTIDYFKNRRHGIKGHANDYANQLELRLRRNLSIHQKKEREKLIDKKREILEEKPLCIDHPYGTRLPCRKSIHQKKEKEKFINKKREIFEEKKSTLCIAPLTRKEKLEKWKIEKQLKQKEKAKSQPVFKIGAVNYEFPAILNFQTQKLQDQRSSGKGNKKRKKSFAPENYQIVKPENISNCNFSPNDRVDIAVEKSNDLEMSVIFDKKQSIKNLSTTYVKPNETQDNRIELAKIKMPMSGNLFSPIDWSDNENYSPKQLSTLEISKSEHQILGETSYDSSLSPLQTDCFSFVSDEDRNIFD